MVKRKKKNRADYQGLLLSMLDENWKELRDGDWNKDEKFEGSKNNAPKV